MKGYYVAEEFEGQIIGTFTPAKEYYAERNNQMIVVSLSMLIIFGVLLFMINHLVDSRIVQGIHRISNAMKKIAEGNFGIVVNEQGNPEFVMLSDSINKMVEGICQSINQNEKLIAQQKEDMEQNRCLIQNVQNACKDLDLVSGETLENADNIYNGTGEQEKAVADLKQIMNHLTQELNNSVTTSANVKETAGMTSEKLRQTQSQMDLLKDSMQKISEMSMSIEKLLVKLILSHSRQICSL